MDEGWSKLYEAPELYLADELVEKLAEAGIAASIINKKDSVLPSIGVAEVYIKKDDEDKANEILSKFKGE